MRTRGHDGRWRFNARHAFHVLRLDGTGALHSEYVDGRLRIRRGGVTVHARAQRVAIWTAVA